MHKEEKDSVLVIFSDNFPRKSEDWWKSFDTVIAKSKFEPLISSHGLHFIDIEGLVDSGSIVEAAEFLRQLSLLKTSTGDRITKIVKYQGFELWWIHYDDLMYKFSIPYSQNKRLLEYLNSFKKVYLYESSYADLFKIYLGVCGSDCISESKFEKAVSVGTLLQVLISIPFLLWARLRAPNIMVWSSDLFDPPRDHDFRMRFIYDELRLNKIKFIEFIRSMESSRIVLEHAWKRKRPVIYSYSITRISQILGNLFSYNYRNLAVNLTPSNDLPNLEKFKFAIAINYLKSAAGDMVAIRVHASILKFLGVKSAILPAALCRNFPEVVACKIAGIPTIGILHGVASKNYNVYDFMPEFDGERLLSLDKYGMWSEWWRNYYISNSKAYRPEQLIVSGVMRPLSKEFTFSPQSTGRSAEKIKVLFVSEQLAAPEEIMPYLLELIEHKNINLVIKFRPYNDGFEGWLSKNHPSLLMDEKVNILRGTMQDSIKECDIVVGSHSTAVLEALLQHKVPILFNTRKWGDYFDLENYGENHPFFANNSFELKERINNSIKISPEKISKLLERFFGDPYQNGSKWVVKEALKQL